MRHGFTLLLVTALACATGGASAGDEALPARPAASGATGGVAVLASPSSAMVLLRGWEFPMGSSPGEVVEAALLCARDQSAELCSLPLGRETVFNRRSPVGLEGIFANELALHAVSLSPFWIDRREVTVAEYRRCVEVSACSDPALAEGSARFDHPRFPMSHVTWTDASTYCAWRGGRLPTEAEWERAARGTKGRRFPWGDLYNRHLANHGALEATFLFLPHEGAPTRVSTLGPDARDGVLSLSDVGSFPDGRTPEGIDDLAGNVAEWVADWFAPRYPEASAHDPRGPAEGTFRIVRGGSFLHPAPYLRGAARIVADGGERNAWIGFRCAKDGLRAPDFENDFKNEMRPCARDPIRRKVTGRGVPRARSWYEARLPGGIPMVDKVKKIWLEGELIDWDDAKVHVLTHTLHYGLGAFEGIRAYKRADGRTSIFRLDAHVERLFDTCKLCLMEPRFTFDQVKEAHLELLRANGMDEAYLRPMAYVGDGDMGIYVPNNPIRTVVIAWKWGAYLGAEALAKGIRTKISSWARHHINVSLAKGKIMGQYTNSILAKREAKLGGYDEAILLDTQGYVSEGSGENIFIVKKGKIITPPLSASILAGITRDTIIRIAEEEGLPLEEDRITRDQLYLADEVFFTGTAAEVTPVREVDDRKVGDGRPGPIAQRLQKRYFDIVKGTDDSHPEWHTFV